MCAATIALGLPLFQVTDLAQARACDGIDPEGKLYQLRHPLPR